MAPDQTQTSANTAAKKKTAKKRTPRSVTHRKAATDKRNALIKQLRDDLKATKQTLKAVKVAARAEATVLKDELKAALKREQELVKIGEKKIAMMVSAGEKWEKRQVAKIRKIVAKKRRV